MREYKGCRIEKHLNDYTVIDLETCGVSNLLRCKIIEFAAIKVRDGKVVDEFSSLVNPKMSIPREIVALTGISDGMVEHAPFLETVLPEYMDFIGSDIVLGFGINTFDYNILYDLSESLLGNSFSNDFVDICYAAQRAVKDVENHKLTTLCNKFAVDYSGAHRALKDCHLTKQVYDILHNEYAELAFTGRKYQVDQYEGTGPKYSDETIQLRELQTLLYQINEDDEVSESEAVYLREWLNSNYHLRGNYPYDRVYDVLEKVFEDGVVESEELQLLLDKFTEFTNPACSTCESISSIADKHFVLTGEFSYGSRSSVEEYIQAKGGIIDNTVKKATDFVIIGSLGSQAWKNGTYGGKIKKAMELKDKGHAVELVAEEDFFSKEGR